MHDKSPLNCCVVFVMFSETNSKTSGLWLVPMCVLMGCMQVPHRVYSDESWHTVCHSAAQRLICVICQHKSVHWNPPNMTLRMSSGIFLSVCRSADYPEAETTRVGCFNTSLTQAVMILQRWVFLRVKSYPHPEHNTESAADKLMASKLKNKCRKLV